MAYKLNGKFVSKVEYEAQQQRDAIEAFGDDNQEAPVTNEQTEENPIGNDKPKKPRTTDPLTAATIRVRKARKELERVTKLHEKRTELPSLDAVQSEYDNAAAQLEAALYGEDN